jgi:hypothetical protein
MTHTFKCPICSRELSVSDKVFDDRIAGKRVSVKCKHCNAPLTENDTSQNSTATAASPSATEPGTSKPAATQLASTQPAPAKPTSVVTTSQPRKPSPDTAQATPAKPSLVPVTVPPRPRHEERPPAQNGSATQAAAPRPASATSAASQLFSAAVAPTSPRAATRPPWATHENELDDMPEIPIVAPPSSASPSPTVAIAPMPIVNLGRDAVTNQSQAATAPSSSAFPTTVADSALAQSSQASSESPTFAESRPGENEMTPSAITLVPGAEPPRLSEPDMSIVAPKRFSRQKGARWAMKLGSVAALLLVALTFGLGTVKKGSPLRPTKPAPPATAVRAITQSTRVSTPPAVILAAGVAAASAVPTAVASAEAPPTPPAENPPAVASPSSRVAPDANGYAASDDTIPDYVSKSTLILVTDVAIRRAQRCHPHGHAAGTARLFMTFAPNGSVSDIRIEGEPVASAPVAGCILSRARSIRIAKFEGAPFTYAKSITMH